MHIHPEDPVREAEIRVDEADLPVALVVRALDDSLARVQHLACVAAFLLLATLVIVMRLLHLAHPFDAAHVFGHVHAFLRERVLRLEVVRKVAERVALVHDVHRVDLLHERRHATGDHDDRVAPAVHVLVPGTLLHVDGRVRLPVVALAVNEGVAAAAQDVVHGFVLAGGDGRGAGAQVDELDDVTRRLGLHVRRHHVRDEDARSACLLPLDRFALHDRRHRLAPAAALALAIGEPALIAGEVLSLVLQVRVLPRLMRPPALAGDRRLAEPRVAFAQQSRVVAVLLMGRFRRVVGHPLPHP